MESCIRFVLCIAVFAQLTQFHGLASCACVCNEKGTDYCEGCDESRVVRPKPKSYSDNYDLNMPPIGDNCWCSKLLIEPAAQPKPPCPKHKKTKCGCNNRVSYSRYSDTVDYSHLNYANTETTKSKSKDDTQPADPVSVSLAVQAGKAIQVPEAKLAYGFLQKPVDGLKKIYFSTVPEENLFKLNSDVITLKKRQQNTRKEQEDEFIAMEEDEELDQSSDDNDNEQPHLTYKQLGYVTEQFKNPKFRRVSSSSCRSSERSSYSGRKRLSDRVSVDCGFKPGRISTYRKIKTKTDSYNCY